MLIRDDPDVPARTWVHGVLHNMPAEMREVSEGMPDLADMENGVRQGRNDFGRSGYGGPSPPRGKPHRDCVRL